MTYELAKQLKDAGFPHSKYWQIINGNMWCDDSEAPTLSELIEACGDGFGYLEKNFSWWARDSEEQFLECRGKTPEEAVAKLWLTLNKNNENIQSS